MQNLNKEIWEERYANNEVLLSYPFDSVVSFIFKSFKGVDRRKIKVLDLGCGGGNHVSFLASEGFDYYGIDYSKSAVSSVRKFLHSKGFDTSTVIQGDVRELPYDNNFFDAIIDRQVIGQNCWLEIQKIYFEVYRVLKKNGLYYGLNFFEDDENIHYATHISDGDYTNFREGKLKGLGQRHFFSLQQLYSLLSRFNIIDINLISKKSLIRKKPVAKEVCVIARKELYE